MKEPKTFNDMYILNDDGIPCYRGKCSPFSASDPVLAYFNDFTCREDYEKANIKYIVPMTAKEIESKEEQLNLLSSTDYFVEEKFDGTRGIMHFFKVPEYEPVEDEDLAYLHRCLLRGSGFVDGSRRIYGYFKQNLSDRVGFLKDEYGIGGASSNGLNFATKASGLTIVPKNRPSKTFSWSEVAKNIQWLIDEGYYYPQGAYTRVFSRRESKKTGWLAENTDSVPQLRDLNIPSLAGTIIDGEMFIPNQPFKAVSSTLNCKPDKAIARQIDLGGIVFHAFDILFFKGIDLRNMPLYRRKVYLEIVCNTINSPYVKNVRYYDEDNIPVKPLTMSQRDEVIEKSMLYPNLAKDVKKHIQRLKTYTGTVSKNDECLSVMLITKKSYYEYITYIGGEGVILKAKSGKYYHKRTREYQKIKKFLTRECIICGFTPPTKEYTGKTPTPEEWDYWEDTSTGDLYDTSTHDSYERVKELDTCIPVTKHYFYHQIGNIEYGVIITDEEIEKLPKNKKHDIRLCNFFYGGEEKKVLVVGECNGFDDTERAWFTEHQSEVMGSVIEVKANEIFRDTGKLRHPRFLRRRVDKNATDCTFKEHIQ